MTQKNERLSFSNDRPRYSERFTTVDQIMKLDEDKISKKGVLLKRGGIFSGYTSKYLFYIEGTYLKYGKKGKAISGTIDLRYAYVKKSKESQTKFKIYHSGDQKLKVKAENSKDREDWINIMEKIAQQASVKERNQSLEEIKRNNSSKKQSEKKRTLSSKKNSHKKITLNQITEMIQSQDSKLNKMIEQSQSALEGICQKLGRFENESLDKKQKDKFQPVNIEVRNFKTEMRLIFEMIAQLNQSLYNIVELIAEKEIERDPIEFIRQESFVQKDSQIFQSFKEKEPNGFVSEIKEEESKFEHEEEEKEDGALEKRVNQFNKESNNEEYQYFNFEDKSLDNSQIEEEIEEIFYDANEYVPADTQAVDKSILTFHRERQGTLLKEPTMVEEIKQLSEPDDPEERFVLPYFKDPKMKISLWTILKDSIGKDLTKISMPVYFNDPTNILQRCASTQEYNHLIDDAIQQKDPLKRLAYLCCYQISTTTNIEKNSSKPFNPMLGETYELVTNKFRMIIEMVSHHPPIAAFEVQGYSGYRKRTNSRLRQKFTGKQMQINTCYKDYIELLPHNEKYVVTNATVTVNNLIIGTMYLDIKDKAYVRSVTRPGEYGVIHYHERGWSASSYFKVDGEVFNANKELVYKIEAKWNEYATIINCKTGEREIVWRKNPYPEKWQQMYGMSHFMIQLNYLPNFLRKKLPHTDTRFRPDQRALENGDLKTAAAEKTRLEEKQRAVRRYREKNGIEYKPAYFEPWENPDDSNTVYWKYNGLYFEKDRQEQNWSRLPDLFSEKLPPEIEEFERQNTKK